MAPCAELTLSTTRTPMPMRALALALLLSAALAGCGRKATRPDRPSEPIDTTEQPAPPAEPPADKGDPEGRFSEALELMKQKKTAEAEAAFLALTQDFPEFSGPVTNLGILFAKSNRRNEAIAAFTRAFNWLGILNREAGNHARARESYEKAISIKPDYAAAHLNLGLLLENQLRQPEQAVAHYREYYRISGGKDLRVLPWIAEIEARQAPAPEASSAATPAPGTGPDTDPEREIK
jgi:tetratricopeptide (TPR) repeat protein